jgi:hypothetical protein
MGQKKGKESTCLDYKKERRNYRGGKEKAFTVDEGAVGGKKERPKEVVPEQRFELTPSCGKIAQTNIGRTTLSPRLMRLR